MNSSDNVYSETAFGLEDDPRSRDSIASSKRSTRSASIETTLTSYTQSTASEVPLLNQMHHYHELEEQRHSPRPKERTSPQSPLLIRVSSDDLSLKSNSLVRNT